MSSVTVKALHREFFYNGTRIPDPAPSLTVEQVREILTPSHPEIATAYYAGDHGIAREQLNYHNPDVVAYVLAVRRQFVIRKYAAMRPQRRSTP